MWFSVYRGSDLVSKPSLTIVPYSLMYVYCAVECIFNNKLKKKILCICVVGSFQGNTVNNRPQASKVCANTIEAIID